MRPSRFLLAALALLAACQSEPPAPAGAPASPPPPAGPTVVGEALPASGDPSSFSLEGRFPQLAGLSEASRQAAVNRRLRQTAEALVDTFRSDLGALAADGRASSFFADYTVSYLSERLFSGMLHTMTYYAGAAHPSQASRALNYDLRTGDPIALAALFRPGTAYLDTLSRYSAAALKAQAAQDGLTSVHLSEMIEAGTAPDSSNFACFNLTPSALVLAFDPYQVGPYAWGKRRVEIPLAALRPLLDPGGPAALLAAPPPVGSPKQPA